MNVVIIEDEVLATDKLERYLLKYNSKVKIVAKITSVEEAINWFTMNSINYDIIFMDIQLTDGLSLEIFNNVTIKKPVVFVTAYDEFAIDAFKVNSIDYILKPINFTDLATALNKLKNMTSYYTINESVSNLKKEVERKNNKERFMVKLGNYIHAVNTETDIALFYAEGRTVYLVTNENKKYIIDFTIKDLVKVLNSKTFFRVNRTFIISINTIANVVVYSNSRLKINPKVKIDELIIVSRDNTGDFKKWFEGDFNIMK
ncbi:LytTR family DNA-binding domain-containing protein [uncultured Psychroserpens sp.]|uniref:LytR/AlgR family response regulator transcription factor n=1 Tax=uncultured Psychroserpens sp. TaxID=255436 RepID=UPI002608A790|nr:LytTR family DNA-binding domain-containing protein [uncultured Psychroserpens sp.]